MDVIIFPQSVCKALGLLKLLHNISERERLLNKYGACVCVSCIHLYILHVNDAHVS